MGIPSVTISVMADLLVARLNAGDRDGATETVEEVRRLSSEVHRPASIAEIEVLTGQMWEDLEEFDAAVAAYQRARVIYRDLGRRAAEARVLGALSGVLADSERYQEEYAVALEEMSLVRSEGDASDPWQEQPHPPTSRWRSRTWDGTTRPSTRSARSSVRGIRRCCAPQAGCTSSQAGTTRAWT